MLQFLEQGDNQSLQYVIRPEEPVDLLTFEMIENNPMRGLLDLRVLEVESGRELRYDVTGLISLKDSLERGKFTREGLFKLIRAILEILVDAQDYLIPPERFVLDNESVFLCYDNDQVKLLCLPLEREDAAGFQDYCKELLKGDFLLYSPQDHACLDALTKALEQEEFKLDSFKGTLDAIEKNPVQWNMASPADAGMGQAPLWQQEVPMWQGEVPQETLTPHGFIQQDVPGQQAVPEVAVESISARTPDMLRREMYEEKTLLRDDEELPAYSAPKKLLEEDGVSGTVVRSQPQEDDAPQQASAPKTLKREENPKTEAASQVQQVPRMDGDETTPYGMRAIPVQLGVEPTSVGQPDAYLVRTKTQEKIPVVEPEFQMGRKAGVQYRISDNPAVSGRHATILFENGTFYFMDNGSSNGSQVNQIQAAKGEKIPLTNGTCVQLANEEFYFYIF